MRFVLVSQESGTLLDAGAVKAMVEAREKERLTVELKQHALLDSTDGQKKLGCAIVALANRRGGRLLLGVRDNGGYEGRCFPDVDKAKGVIDNICHNSISPPLSDYGVDLVDVGGNDVLVITVPRRQAMPHAYTGERKGPEIKSRVYYIRTPHGKRLVTDHQLAWMFRHADEPTVSASYRSVIHFMSKSLGLSAAVAQPKGVLSYYWFLDSVPEADLPRLTRDWNAAQRFFVEVTPFAALGSIASLFAFSWHVKTERFRGRETWGPLGQLPSEKHEVRDHLKAIPGGTLSSLSWEFGTILDGGHQGEFHLPPATVVEIAPGDHWRKSRLSFIHRDFRFDFNFSLAAMGTGLHHTHPQRGTAIDDRHDDPTRGTWSNLHHVEIDTKMSSWFRFPDEDVEHFEAYYHCAETLKELLHNDWDYDLFVERMPDSKLYSIENGIERLLQIVAGKQAWERTK